MKSVWLFLFLIGAVGSLLGLPADEPWVLVEGPLACSSIPLTPLQPVDSWRGHYRRDREDVWVYLTRSLQFFPPAKPSVRLLGTSGWWVVVFVPVHWKSEQLVTWLDLWSQSFRVLESLPQKGYPIALPGVLR